MILHKHHIIPKHVGGTNNKSNLIELTPEQHAEAHRKLWKKYSRWQDFCAWQGLAKLSKDKEHIKLVMSERNKASWKDPVVRAKRIAGMKSSTYKNRTCNRKNYEITTPKGKKIKIHGLRKWCKDNGLNHNSFWRATIADSRQFQGYTAKRLTK